MVLNLLPPCQVKVKGDDFIPHASHKAPQAPLFSWQPHQLSFFHPRLIERKRNESKTACFTDFNSAEFANLEHRSM